MRETQGCNENVTIAVLVAVQQFPAREDRDARRRLATDPRSEQAHKRTIMIHDHHGLLAFLADEAQAALLRVQRLSGIAKAPLQEAEELTAIRLNIIRRKEEEAQLELPLDLKAAA